MPGKKNNLLPALEKGKKTLTQVWENQGSREMLSSVCGCTVREDKIIFDYFGSPSILELPDFVMDPPGISQYEQIMIFHYLSRPFEKQPVPKMTEDSPSTGSWITFKQLPNAEFYNSTYQRRGPKIILSEFAPVPEKLLEAGGKLGGEKGSYGDYSVIIRPLPAIQAMAVLYSGDEEFPPEAEILFTSNIGRFLPLEDTAVLAGIIASRLKKAADAAQAREQ